MAVINELRFDQGQYQCGKTKMFIRHPETVFQLEEMLERMDFEMCVVWSCVGVVTAMCVCARAGAWPFRRRGVRTLRSSTHLRYRVSCAVPCHTTLITHVCVQMRAMASDMMKGKKERQHSSQNRSYDGDYLKFDQDFGVQQVFAAYKDEEILFYDAAKKINRRGKQEDRLLVVTDGAIYIIAKAIEKKQA
jgi:myosin-1